ncbi:MAG: 6,7-dimethyl-8-ribityllumazine synthase [Bacteroidetes bacterium]|nr:6,7-dimethyl-8-ribityllumazine synthase [Bacteroidota bacterium]
MATEQSPRVYEGGVSAEGKRFAIVVSTFNSAVTQKLLDGALQCFAKHGARQVEVFRCPGAYELPQVASHITRTVKYDAVLCLGAVIRGETPHFDYICQECARGIGRVSYERDLPVLFGVLTTDTFEQAMERAGGSVGNKGYDTALGAIEMSNLFTHTIL